MIKIKKVLFERIINLFSLYKSLFLCIYTKSLLLSNPSREICVPILCGLRNPRFEIPDRKLTKGLIFFLPSFSNGFDYSDLVSISSYPIRCCFELDLKFSRWVVSQFKIKTLLIQPFYEFALWSLNQLSFLVDVCWLRSAWASLCQVLADLYSLCVC